MLADLIDVGLDIVFCGTAVGNRSAARGAYYAGSGNRFWRILAGAGFTPRVFAPADYMQLLEYGVGLTDLVKGRSGMDSSLAGGDFDTAGFIAKIEDFTPRIVAFNGKRAARVVLGPEPLTYGHQETTVAGAGVWVLPSTSGAAGRYWAEEPWLALAAAVRTLDRGGRHQHGFGETA